MAYQKNQLSCHSCEGRKHGVFCNLSSKGVEDLNTDKIANLYKKDQNLFVEGNPPFGIHCIHSGKIKITKTSRSGKETIIRLAGAGEILGHRSLFSHTPYMATATVLEDSIVCFVSKAMILKLVKEDPLLSMDIMSSISRQMGAAEERIASLSNKSQKERFAEMLLLLNEAYGTTEGELRKLNIKLTREEMGSMIGAASENVIRLITEFKKEGLVSEVDKYLYLLDIEKIEQKANLPY
jgi:CRP/FNR family transcriptional regulator, polysaccharide utilization system transcription regulator